MISALILRKFGRFSGTTLKFSPFTVVTGPNEAGKTTVFDALFENLCECGKNDLVYRRLKERYGKDRKSALEWAAGAKPQKYDAYEFLDIFAIRGGRIHLDASGGGAWFRAFKNALFTGGMDPAELAAGLLAAGSEARNKPHMKKLAALEAEIADLKADLDAERNKRTAVLEGEEAIKRLAAVLEEANKKSAEKEAQLAALKPGYESARNGAELDQVRKELAALRELEELEEKLSSLTAYTSGALSAHDQLMDAHEEKKEALNLLRGQLAEKEKALQTGKTMLESARAAMPVLRRQDEVSRTLRTEIENFLTAGAHTVKKTVDRWLRFAVWGAGLALAAGLYFWLKGAAGAAVAAVVALLAGATGWFAAVKTTMGYIDPQAGQALLSRLADDWSNAGFDAAQVRRETLQGMQDALSTVQAGYTAALEALENSETAFVAAETDKIELSARAGLAEDARREAEEAAGAWLEKHGCRTRDEFSSKADLRARTAEEAGARRETVSAAARLHGCRDVKDFRFRLQDRAERLERAGARPGLPIEEVKRLEREYEDLREECRLLKERLLREEAELVKQREVAATRLEGVPETLNALAVALAGKEAEAAEIKLTLAGYKIAAAAFARIAANSAIKLETLSVEVGGMLRRMLPGRPVRFSSYGLDGAAMNDAGGDLRPVEDLSAGTRDLFMLAARLALAKKTRTGAGGKLSSALLVLDEPFYTLDEERTVKALRLLSDFRKETGWQILILTKDPSAARAAKDIGIPDAAEIRL